jgi:hypothetical protein
VKFCVRVTEDTKEEKFAPETAEAAIGQDENLSNTREETESTAIEPELKDELPIPKQPIGSENDQILVHDSNSKKRDSTAPLLNTMRNSLEERDSEDNDTKAEKTSTAS